MNLSTLTTAISVFFILRNAFAFEGSIEAILTRNGDVRTFVYTGGTNLLRIERGESDRPYARNILNRDTGELTLLFPHNRSFVRLKPQAETSSATRPGVLAMPAMPPGVGPRTQLASAPPASVAIGPTNLPGMPDLSQMPTLPAGLPPGVGPQPGNGLATPAMPQMPMPMGGGMPAMPMMPPMMMEKTELTATGDKTNLLGYACQKYEIRQRGEVLEIWATDKLLPFQPYQQNQPHRFGPRMMEEQWGGLLKAKKLFPLLAVLRLETPVMPGAANRSPAGPERMRFEVKTVKPEKIEDKDGVLFRPPTDYHELEPLPF